jgi:hypothetical protein
MSSWFRAASIAWTFAAVGAVGGGFAVGRTNPLALALFALGVALAVTELATILVAMHRRSRRRRFERRAAAGSRLGRLEYLPAVTTPAPLLHWQGSQYWSFGRWGLLGQDHNGQRKPGGPAAASAPGAAHAHVAEAGVAEHGGVEAVAPVDDDTPAGE